VLNAARNFLGGNDTVETQGGFGNGARNRFGDDNTVTTQGGYGDLATNLVGTGNTVTSRGGYYNTARNVGGSGNELSVGGPSSSLNAALNFGGGRNILNAGGPGSLNLGFNALGNANNVAAGPGPLALAGAVLKDGQTVTRTKPGIAINADRIGGTAATNTKSNPVRKSLSATVSKVADRLSKPGKAATANATGDKNER
jgi:hypothetical protein